MTKSDSEITAAGSEWIGPLITTLKHGGRSWNRMSLEVRADLITQVAQRAAHTAETWVDIACSIKKIDPQSSIAGEEWISGPYAVVSSANALAHTLKEIGAGRSPVTKRQIRPDSNGRTIVDVFPSSKWDRLLLNGFKAEVWMQIGVSPEQVQSQAGLGQRTLTATNGISAVLGAGNITSIPVLDTIYELIAHNRAVLLKLNPITDPLIDVYREVLGPLIDMDLVRVVAGDGEVGEQIIGRPEITHVHITGSEHTHDRIVWGTGEEAVRRRSDAQPKLAKSITSELGGVSPAIVVPGKWSRADIQYQANHVATQRLHNNGYNCIGTQVLVVQKNWDQKDEFIQAVQAVLRRLPGRAPYYPGSDSRVEQALSHHPNSDRINTDRVLISASADVDEEVFNVEYFSPVLAVVELDGDDLEYLHSAASFANETLHGTLGINVIVAPKTRRRLNQEFDRFIESLRYGTIAINTWTGFGYLTPAAPWGAYPGHTIEDVQSGIGVVHNTLLLEDTERCVVTGPFRPFPRSFLNGEMSLCPVPPWFVSNRTAQRTGRNLVAFVSKPRWLKLPSVFSTALRG